MANRLTSLDWSNIYGDLSWRVSGYRVRQSQTLDCIRCSPAAEVSSLSGFGPSRDPT
jgi:hypothetical protein